MSIPVKRKDNWIATIITWMFFQNIIAADNCKCMHIIYNVRDIQCPFYTNHANSFFVFLFICTTSQNEDEIDIHKNHFRNSFTSKPKY